jgi:TetR/AcrR family tetracycline transcriptional repressor
MESHADETIDTLGFSAGTIALVLRSYTTGFVILRQAFLELKIGGEWDSLVQEITASGYPRIDEADDAVAILTGDRDQRFAVGLATILAETADQQSN